MTIHLDMHKLNRDVCLGKALFTRYEYALPFLHVRRQGPRGHESW